MIPYIVPQMIPIGIGSPAYGNIGSPMIGGYGSPILGGQGLIHSGPGIGGMMQPIFRSIPYGYGYGLLHSGPEIPGITPIGYGIGPGPIGYGPIGFNQIGPGPIGYGYGSMLSGMGVIGNQGGYSSPPLQPAWSGGLGTNI